ncbi:L-histidine N(alpha)-methyltransferase [Pseudoroseomonas wenyumeiae]|uniref:L-histidine N(Alpha)-methyltransferase n=1 Tax=Teichococcus wenyumeiae TaxID=2478470 RepID=A0A3A9JNQ9_9PROT|nr:L-histidine N(alpha)-methyltransferase [Pseudoroseomonas wenyumeiae]RKK06165.1 L-histidine N(alpha)-methyltransferase [Pseudoroseomonas wenyumeiae]RMI17506.1 L-histidine N(alpha)-methyltransferase [Pseudoroseomonas wenyumeiae]
MSGALSRDPAEPQRAALMADALTGLSAMRKTLPCKWLYDAEGTRLFEAITNLPEYYPTRTEVGILEECGPEIARAVGPGAAVVEFGPGDGAKAVQLLRQLDAPVVYLPVDIAPEWLAAAASRVAEALPALRVQPVVADFTQPFDLAGRAEGSTTHLGFFPGSTIGNFEPTEAVTFLRRARTSLRAGARMLLGADLVKDIRVLQAAYDDAAGVTAAFNLNLLARLNREAGADFDLSGFGHEARWNAAASRIEMHLVARRAQSVRLGGRVFRFAAGDSIHTESSHKYHPEHLRALAEAAGWQAITMWTDPGGKFSVWLLES